MMVAWGPMTKRTPPNLLGTVSAHGIGILGSPDGFARVDKRIPRSPPAMQTCRLAGLASFEGGDPTAGCTRFQKTSIGDGDVMTGLHSPNLDHSRFGMVDYRP